MRKVYCIVLLFFIIARTDILCQSLYFPTNEIQVELPKAVEKKRGGKSFSQKGGWKKNVFSVNSRLVIDTNSSIYSIGTPSIEEQYALELINRARTNSFLEGVWLMHQSYLETDVRGACIFFGVDTNIFLKDIMKYPSTSPLSFNVSLINAAREHTIDMYVNNYQSHIGSDGSSPFLRMERNGYTGWNWAAENAGAYGRSSIHIHASYQIDWGCCGAGGMQNPAGHRNNIHSGYAKEIGIGMTNAPIRGSVGPILSTQNFGARNGWPIFITGVCYTDDDNDKFYSKGEGMGGILICSENITNYAISSFSGGYSLPIYSNGNYIVHFTDTRFFTNSFYIEITNSQNFKLDLVLPKFNNAIVSPNYVILGQTNTFSVSGIFPLGSETEIKTSKLFFTNFLDGAESNAMVYFDISTNYATKVTDNVFAGVYAYRLVQPQPVDQYIYLDPVFHVTNNTRVSLNSRLAWATTNQVGRLEYSLDQGRSWNTFNVFTGTESPFVPYTSFSSNIGFLHSKDVLFRMTYDHMNGSYYYQTSQGIGWRLDNLSVSNVYVRIDGVTNNIGDNYEFDFVGVELGEYYLNSRISNDGGTTLYGASKKISVIKEIHPISSVQIIGNFIHINFNSILSVNYSLDYTYDFVNWASLGNFIGDGNNMLLTDGVSLSGFKFYRIRAF